MVENIVILTGAGVSAESGLGTFRDAGGLWTRYALEDVATPEGFARDPGLVLEFYSARRENCRTASPNAAHRALAELESAWPGGLLLVTQNIDDLHERAGTRRLVHMHGELMACLCAACGRRWPSAGPMHAADRCPACAAAAVRPDVVWFGEYPYHMKEIGAALGAADLFVSIGTSGSVYPAAGFVQEAARAGARTLELNLDPSDGASLFDAARRGPATELVPAWVAEMLGG
ncbi:NAD-dependent deacylase [Paroceanicella profunda]|uniref:NAD-dependent protein deacylase n=1 Tax=Paroceanicella profunda TaxID=2579971 RepID=A0A5B8FYM0_9RHOB|nr:NAD-dependent deacylase [Paroceanicella profunda]QDL92470.1 NAD-dependent deacylase [Paroceanicella profunda]